MLRTVLVSVCPEEYSHIIELYRAMEMTLWLPQAEAVLAQVETGPAPQRG